MFESPGGASPASRGAPASEAMLREASPPLFTPAPAGAPPTPPFRAGFGDPAAYFGFPEAPHSGANATSAARMQSTGASPVDAARATAAALSRRLEALERENSALLTRLAAAAAARDAATRDAAEAVALGESLAAELAAARAAAARSAAGAAEAQAREAESTPRDELRAAAETARRERASARAAAAAAEAEAGRCAAAARAATGRLADEAAQHAAALAAAREDADEAFASARAEASAAVASARATAAEAAQRASAVERAARSAVAEARAAAEADASRAEQLKRTAATLLALNARLLVRPPYCLFELRRPELTTIFASLDIPRRGCCIRCRMRWRLLATRTPLRPG